MYSPQLDCICNYVDQLIKFLPFLSTNNLLAMFENLLAGGLKSFNSPHCINTKTEGISSNLKTAFVDWPDLFCCGHQKFVCKKI